MTDNARAAWTVSLSAYSSAEQLAVLLVVGMVVDSGSSLVAKSDDDRAA